MTVLPPRHVTGVPHHRDVPVYALTRLSTKPINRLRYIQIRQRTLFPITPLFGFAEFARFKFLIKDPQFRIGTRNYPPHEAHRNHDWEKLAIHWNSLVHMQSRSETDANKRYYYKLPSHLERHFKRTLEYKSELSTLLMGTNAAALKPFHDLLAASDNYTVTLDAQMVPEFVPKIPIGEVDKCYRQNGK